MGRGMQLRAGQKFLMGEGKRITVASSYGASVYAVTLKVVGVWREMQNKQNS